MAHMRLYDDIRYTLFIAFPVACMSSKRNQKSGSGNAFGDYCANYFISAGT